MIGVKCADYIGITNHHAKNLMELGGAILGGTAAGAVVGGPIGAAAGAAVATVSYTAEKTISAICATGFGKKGPNDNWCYVEVGQTHGYQICVGTYNSSDSWYVKTYWSEYRK